MMVGESILPKKLKELRKAHSYTQDFVAASLGIVRQTYSHYETGKRTPSSEMLYKLAGLYDISIDDLMHLIMNIDRSTYFDAPPPSETSLELNDYLEYVNSPVNANKLTSYIISAVWKRNFYFTFRRYLKKIKKK
ncbi:helix-turn-helix domain-containing protein [Pseudobutyrivibrio xylanivorans]|uniref:helix-turn-helix domain-containing protein n=1 Tax=Pseudobutyrivibrio xylanivorans TaxID=185007 RepID=UPI001FAB0C23|nr:helix-turn-helix transcriptional regulator [Pseudobutyrivibrio xylanivorans]